MSVLSNNKAETAIATNLSNQPDAVAAHRLPVATPDRFESDDELWQMLAHDVLPAYLASRRWFAKDGQPGTARPVYRVALNHTGTTGGESPDRDPDRYVLAEFDVETAHGPARYFVPVAASWSDTTPLARQSMLAQLIAGSKQGVLTDAYTVAPFAHDMIGALREGQVIDIQDGASPAQLHFLPETGLQVIDLPRDAPIKWFLGEQSNSSLSVGGKIMLKLVRRVANDINPEAEMTRRLTRVGFTNGAALLGEVVRRHADGSQATLAVAHQSIANDGDAWSWTQAYLASRVAQPTGHAPDLQDYAKLARAIGLRLAQMHAALTLPTDDPAFAPEVATASDARIWRDDIMAMLARVRDALTDVSLTDKASDQRDWLIANSDALENAVSRQVLALPGSLRIRIHGDFHLGQILVAGHDAYLIDFEGEPARTPAERRSKNTPLRDVAGLLRSFAYARAAFLSIPDTVPPSAPHAVVRQDLRDAFVRNADDAFLDQYRATLTRADRPWFLPATLDTLLPLAVMEKAAYEVVYEAGHRPTWLHIPLTGLIDMAARILVTDSHNA